MDSQPDNDCPSDSDTRLNGIDQEMEYNRMDSGDGQTFTEVFPGCSNSYPGRLTFMDLFWQNEHAEKWQENLYFPFASANEWQFLSWCICSRLSMAAINSLLSLSIVSNRYFCPDCD